MPKIYSFVWEVFIACILIYNVDTTNYNRNSSQEKITDSFFAINGK